MSEMPLCTRCGHSIDDHVHPGRSAPGEDPRPWPCGVEGCGCPGFVVSQRFDSQEPTPQLDIEKTDERIESCGFRRTRWGAERLRKNLEPQSGLSSYHCRVERRGLFRWEVVAYQNKPVIPA